MAIGPSILNRYPTSSLSLTITFPSQNLPPTSSSSDLPVKLAKSAIKTYKKYLSPLLPPSCRFLPTCSIYASESYTEFGFTKGTILTIWRLMRCTPVGGKGYDPPRWPPVRFREGIDDNK
ncbi:hypothetical protein TL16_g11416 [Triparma laevis f. inornata]|uniref:Membrane protein insertion efficiency factor n=2 Tax=Triparma laevis TaxID=1534972 RepID=A0A9W6ZJC0_9STRA|nr:hypothetical protein TrLO_g2521 [Triparma laevis f. longispina]GMH89299.1 hypothetical protein TL16_g11416 [Triparma laevis f. inornata]